MIVDNASELKLELQNRAISRAAIGLGSTAQVAAVATALCWPVGLFVGGWLGVAALATSAAVIMGGTVAAISDEITKIEDGDKARIRHWLQPADIEQIATAHGLQGAPSPKPLGVGAEPEANPSTSPQTQTEPTAAPENVPSITEVITGHLSSPVVAVVGAQGVGKSTFLHWLYGQIDGAAIALDPHAAKGDHQGPVVVGAGMDYQAIQQAVAAIRELVASRYRERAEGVTDFPPLLVVAEELTNWGDKVGSAKTLIKEALSDFRKANVRLVLVSHGKTNALMGNSEGMAALRGAGMLMLEIHQKGQGTLTIPGDKPRQQPVAIPLLHPVDRARPPLPFSLDAQQGTPTDTTPDIPQQVVALLQRKGAMAAWEVRNSIRVLKSEGTDHTRLLLDSMATDGLITALDGKYSALDSTA